MRFLTVFLLFLAFVAGVQSKLLYSRQQIPSGWIQKHKVGHFEHINFHIALKQSNLEQLEATFWDVSDPDSVNYRNFLDVETIKSMVAPKKKHRDDVVNWLQHNGIKRTAIKDFTDAIRVRAPVKAAEKLFNTEFYHFEHPDGRRTIAHMGESHIPDHISNRVDFVSGLSYFPIKKFSAIAGQVGDGMDGFVPQSFASLYNVPNLEPASAYTTSQGVIEFEGENFDQSDLTAYGQQVNINVQNIPSNQIIGSNDPTNPQTEAVLDIEMITGLNPSATSWFWIEDPQYWLYDWTISFFNAQSVPQVISISYGWWEGDQCDIDSLECGNLGVDSTGYVKRVNVEFQKIALRGISVLVSSGDSGANGRTDSDCSIPRLRPAYPSSSPYVTSVGATQLQNQQYNLPNLPPACQGQGYNCPSSGVEVAVSYNVASFASGGGFSDIAPAATYQKPFIDAYFKSGVQLPPKSYFNQTGRGAPDVSAIGNQCLIYQSGLTPVGGTSCSAPVFAAVVSYLNQYAIQKDGKPLGFLNPFLYKMASVDYTTFNDVTSGDNKCTEDGCSSSCQGYYAAKGWDPVSGLGTPNAAKMLEYLKNNL